MPIYRAYRLDPYRHITSADWVEAESDPEALAQPQELCGPETPKVELWQAARLVEEIDCHKADED